MKFRWPFNKQKHKHWLGIHVSSLAPSAVIYSDAGIEKAICFDQEQGIEVLYSWLKEHADHGMPSVLVLDDDDYELLLVEAPDVPADELSAALEFRIGDLLAQPIEDTAIQAVRLPEDAYRGRMSMAHVIAAPNEKVKAWVRWASKLHLSIESITVPELSLLNVLAACDVQQGIALLELGPKQGCIRLYQDGALYLTRQVEVGIDALGISDDLEKAIPAENESLIEPAAEAIAVNEINLAELTDDDFSSDGLNEEVDLDIADVDELEAIEAQLTIDETAYVGFSAKASMSEQQVQNLVLEVQRSLDYYESQLGMGQITQLWVMAGDRDLTSLVDAMQPALTALVEQPNLITKLSEVAGINISASSDEVNNTVTALGGALAYVRS